MKLSHAFLYVTDQDEALDWYTNKLGLEVRSDVTMEEAGMRWLAVGAPGQDVQITLLVPGPPPLSEAVGEEVKKLLAQGALNGLIFQVDDCRKAYEELSARGVEFSEPPEERFYGVDAGFRDPFGNAFRLVQPSAYDPASDTASAAGTGA
jgi:catechol 2,3-dioxygenase-like lactoylglutathione lyase family enzyme